MAEGGIAAAVGNVDADDSSRQHFIDTLNSGKLLNNWRMAENFTKEAPERVIELEQRGALLDRKSTSLNSSHANIPYSVFCFKKKKHHVRQPRNKATRAPPHTSTKSCARHPLRIHRP